MFLMTAEESKTKTKQSEGTVFYGREILETGTQSGSQQVKSNEH